MREIKFRGKRVDNGEWVYGKSLIQGEIKGRPFIQIEHSDFDEFRQYEVHPETVGQYTGLKDKNGVEIYEGDLIEVCSNKNGLLEVVFINDYVGGWVLTHKSTEKHLSLGARNQTEIEVTGNIHDNKQK